MEIKDYEVIINEENATCGLVVNLDYYDIEDFLKENLFYEIFPHEKKIKVFNAMSAIYFLNVNEEMVYYAYKTDNLTLLGGIVEDDNGNQHGKIKIFAEAKLL